MNDSDHLDVAWKPLRHEMVDGISHVANDRGHGVRSDYMKMRELDLWRCQCDDNESQMENHRGDRDRQYVGLILLKAFTDCPQAQGCVFRIKLRKRDFEGNWTERALKIISRQQTYSIPRRLFAPIEALLLGMVSPHEHISNIHEAYVHQNVAMLVLDLITFDGGEAGRKPRQANLVDIEQPINRLPAAASFLSQLIRILWHTHTRKIAHNDLRASNLLVINIGKVVAIDFSNAVFDSEFREVMDRAYEQDWLHAREIWRDLFELEIAVDGRLDLCEPHLPSQDVVGVEQIIRSLVPGHIPEPCFEELASIPYMSGWHLDCPGELDSWPTIR